MRRSSLLAALLRAVALAAPLMAQAACPPAGHSRASLDALKAARWRVDDAAVRQPLALGLADCLADPDPALRDGVAFPGVGGHWNVPSSASPMRTRGFSIVRLGTSTRPLAIPARL